jgi:hypothetical protein
MGCPSVALLLLLLEERDLVEIGTFEPSFGFKDFRRAARLHSPTKGQFGGEKRAGLRPPPRPQLQGFSSSGLRRRSEASRGLPSRGLASRFFLPHLGWKPSSSSAEEASSSHAGEGELLLPSQGAAFRPLSGRRRSAALGGLTTCRTPRGRYSCSATVPSSFSWRGRE